MKIIEFYEKLLELAGLDHEDGYIVAVTSSGDKFKFKDKDKCIILPTKERLRYFDPEDESIFNPLKEDELKGLSSTFKRFEQALDVQIGKILSSVTTMVLFVKANPSLQKNLNFEGLDFLSDIGGKTDLKTCEAFNKFLAHTLKEGHKLFQSYIKNKGKVKGVKYYKVYSGKFFLMDLLNNGEIRDKLKLRKMDIDTLEQVFEAVMPSTNDNGVVHYGSNHPVSPELDALVKGSGIILKHFNDIIEYFEPIKDELSDIFIDKIDLEVVENFDDIVDSVKSELSRLPYPSGKQNASHSEYREERNTAPKEHTETKVAPPRKEETRSPVDDQIEALKRMTGQSSPMGAYGYNMPNTYPNSQPQYQEDPADKILQQLNMMRPQVPLGGMMGGMMQGMPQTHPAAASMGGYGMPQQPMGYQNPMMGGFGGMNKPDLPWD